MRYTLTLIVFSISIAAIGQANNGAGSFYEDSIVIIKGACKGYVFYQVPSFQQIQNNAGKQSSQVNSTPSYFSTPDIVVHGNVTYNANYRSYLDTPFAQKEVYRILTEP